MRSSRAGSLSTASRVGDRAQRETPCVGVRREFARDPGEQRGKRDARALGREPAGVEAREVEQLRELASSASPHAGHGPTSGCHSGSARARRAPRRTGRARAAAGAGRGWRRRGAGSWRDWRLPLTRAPRAARCDRAELADQVEVLVAHGERACQHVVELMPEAEHEREHDAHDRRDEAVHRVAFQRDADDQRHQRRQHEAVERRLVDGGQVEPAEHHAEQAHDQQRLVRRRRGKHHDPGGAPQRAGERRSERPIAAPARSGCGPGRVRRTPREQRRATPG